MVSVLEIRFGPVISPEEMRETKPDWPEKIFSSSYRKNATELPVTITEHGIEGDVAGFPSHIDDSLNRGILVFSEQTYDKLRDIFPEATATLSRGGFGENMVVDDPSLLPSVVCIGDQFQIGSATFVVTGPRKPCPKVDSWHCVKGMTKLSEEKGWAGYFLRVLTTGHCVVGDKVVLLKRPNPGYDIEFVSELIWGPNAVGLPNADDSATLKMTEEGENVAIAALKKLVSIKDLVARNYGDVARKRLQRIAERRLQEEASIPTPPCRKLLVLYVAAALLLFSQLS